MSRQKFLDSDEAKLINSDLENMVADPYFNTQSTYTTSSGNCLSFVDKHMKYLSDHPKLNPRHYLSNLKLMTRINHK